MNFGQLQDHVLTLAKRRNEAGERELVKEHVNQAYQEVCLRTRCNTTSATVTLTGALDYSLASDFGISDASSLLTVAYNGAAAYGAQRLRNVSLDTILDARSLNTATVGWTSSYATDGDTISFYPGGTTGETITVYYTPRPDPLENYEDTPDAVPAEFHRVIAYGALADAARDPSLADRYAARFEDGLLRIKAWVGVRSGDAAPSVRVGRYQRRPRDPSYYGGGWS